MTEDERLERYRAGLRRVLESGKTQEQLAAMIGKTQGAISQILSGRQKTFSYGDAARLAAVTGTTVEELLEVRRPPPLGLSMTAALTFARANGVREEDLQAFSAIETGEDSTPEEVWTEIKCFAQKRKRQRNSKGSYRAVLPKS